MSELEARGLAQINCLSDALHRQAKAIAKTNGYSFEEAMEMLRTGKHPERGKSAMQREHDEIAQIAKKNGKTVEQMIASVTAGGRSAS